jgi:hypothetical protein
MGGMGKRLTIALAVFALVAVLSEAYVGGYFWLGDREEFDWQGEEYVSRRYSSALLMKAYWPMSQIETRLIGIKVVLSYYGYDGGGVE